MKHSHAFTSAVVNDIIEKHGLPLILRFKSDNCSSQYKYKWVFRFWSSLAKKLNTKIIIYYGVSGHGKVLVDVIGVFGVKSPLTRVVITQNLDYIWAKDIFGYLNDHFKDDASKLYSVLSPEEISKFVIDESPLFINNCMKLHMISYFPNGCIQSKVNICSCDSCIEGEFTSCLIEKGKIVQIVDEASDHDDDDSSESEFENDLESSDESDTEAYELKAESVNSA